MNKVTQAIAVTLMLIVVFAGVIGIFQAKAVDNPGDPICGQICESQGPPYPGCVLEHCERTIDGTVYCWWDCP